ncbi:hypothetical protein PAMA_014440 [Pampus argenteus]
MTRGAGTCWQQEDDDGFQIWLEPPRDNQKPFTDSERAQRWRLSLASLLFLTILLSDHLWFCAEAKLARTRDKFSPSHLLSPQTHSAHSSLRGTPDAIFIGNSTKHLWRLETCHQDSLSQNCFTFADADHLCRGLSDKEGTRAVNMSDLYLSFCNSHSLLDLFYGSTSPDNLNCSLDVLGDGDTTRCSLCVQAYQRYDQHAQEKYEDFELLTQKYEPGAYSVRTCMEQCKVGCEGEGWWWWWGGGGGGIVFGGVMWWPSVDLGPDRCQFWSSSSSPPPPVAMETDDRFKETPGSRPHVHSSPLCVCVFFLGPMLMCRWRPLLVFSLSSIFRLCRFSDTGDLSGRSFSAELSLVLNGAPRLHSQKPRPIPDGLHSPNQRQRDAHRRQNRTSNQAICLLIESKERLILMTWA